MQPLVLPLPIAPKIMMPGVETPLRNDQPVGVFSRLGSLGMMDLAGDHVEPLASGRFRVWRKFGEPGAGSLADHEDVGQREQDRKDNVGRAEKHPEVDVLDAVKEMRFFQQNELEQGIFVRERQPVETDNPCAQSERRARHVPVFHQLSHLRFSTAAATGPIGLDVASHAAKPISFLNAIESA